MKRLIMLVVAAAVFAGCASGPEEPADFTVHTALDRLGDADPWAERMPDPQRLPAELIEEGHTIAIPRVQAMHEGKRRKRAQRG